MDDEQQAAGGTGSTGTVPTLGERLLAGRYRVDQLIGRGGMAEVHLGFDTRLGRRVAVKLLRSSLANDPVFRARFRAEAQAASKMTHPTIVRVFDAGEETVVESGGGEAQLPFIVMEFVDGKLLKDLVADGPMTPAEAGHLMAGILTALEYSHAAGVVHRDIKPGNVMVTRTGQVKVMDFGIARAISDSSATVAQTTAILGTAQYFSPEQAKGETVDSRSDLYSTGVVLFEMLTGEPPFRGSSPVAVAYQHVSERPQAPSERDSRVSERMDAVVLRALEKDKDERYQTAADFREDVEAVVAGRRPAARLPRIAPSADLFGGAQSSPDATVRRLAFDDRSRVQTSTRPPAGWIFAGIVAVAVVVIAVAIWVIGLVTGGFGADDRTVPGGLVGATESSATKALSAKDLLPVVQRLPDPSGRRASGEVMRTVPIAGAALKANDTVRLWVSTGLPRTAVPDDLVGVSQTTATGRIEQAGLKVGSISSQHSPDVPAEEVLSVTPKGGTGAVRGDTVDLVVSDGEVSLPDLTGEPTADAVDALGDLGLTVKEQPSTDCTQNGYVVGQDTAAGDVAQGSTVSLTTCVLG